MDEKVKLLESLRSVGTSGLRGHLRGDADHRVELCIGSGSLAASDGERSKHRQNEYRAVDPHYRKSCR